MEDVEKAEVEDEVSDVNRALSKEILVRKGFYDLADANQQMHVNY